jgi:sugar fermentation stimulation protein A
VLANTLVAEAIQNGLLRKVEQSAANACGHDVWLQHVERLQAEWHWPQEKVRLDFALHTPQGVVLVEVKSVTLAEPDGLGLFPDAKTERGLKQIQALQLAQQQGQRVVLVYCVQNSGVTRFSLAEAIDPAYAQAVRDLMAAGARVIALGCDLSNKGIEARRSVQVVI